MLLEVGSLTSTTSNLGAKTRTQSKVISLQSPFYETSVGSRAIRYKWDPEGRNDFVGGKVTIRAASSADSEPAKVASVGISDGEVILGGLTPNTLYSVIVTVTRDGKQVHNTWDNIKTLSTKGTHATNRPPDPFYQLAVDTESIRVTWDAKDRKELLGAEITMEAMLMSDPEQTQSASADSSAGAVAVDGLTPNTLYLVTVTVTSSGSEVMHFTKPIKTPSKGKL
ncbi:unnamed protein product [Hydatigera taeniaeformis]|uniref:Fibronectin type-III domain-containing protein n=1 Tax=Hydatigena taeniaeformis TaxID=6205 RepID=A0A0R3X7V0_HYDTA|nr:unnamed protein product [Hydatigera taeniaeformis]